MDRLTLTCGCRGRPVREQVIDAEPFGMSMVGVQRVDLRRPFLDDPHPRVTVAVDPALVPLGQAEPALWSRPHESVKLSPDTELPILRGGGSDDSQRRL
jgi:hypothetical protein